jgi:thiaminase/transcriptional activator TenA
MSFASELKSDSIEIWNRILGHVFIQEISNGTMPKEKFIVYLLQDRIFLKEYCILLEKGIKLTNDKNIRKWINELIQDITKNEMKMQRELLEMLRYNDYDTTVVSLPNEKTLNYIYNMRKLSEDTNKLYEIISFIAPCPWIYHEIAEKICKDNRIDDQVIKKWTDFYASYESKQQVDSITHLLNEVSNDLTKIEKSSMKSYFTKACRNELEFWDTIYHTKLVRSS